MPLPVYRLPDLNPVTAALIRGPLCATVGLEMDMREKSVGSGRAVPGDAGPLHQKQPLSGHTILLTREYTSDYAPLGDLGARIIAFPTIMIAPPESFGDADLAISRLATYDWLVITSANAFNCFLGRVRDRGLDVGILAGMRICAIGSRTAETVRRAGLRIDLVPASFSAEGLVEAFLSLPGGRTGLSGLRLLLPRAEKARDLFPEKVRAVGGLIDTPAVYRAVRPEGLEGRAAWIVSKGGVTISTFTSGATFSNFVALAGGEALAFLRRTAISVIGPVTAKAVERAGLPVAIMPAVATIPAMVEAIIGWAGNSIKRK